MILQHRCSEASPAEETHFRHAGGASRRRFLTTAANPLRYSRTSLIRCALAGSDARERGQFSGHRVPDAQRPSQIPVAKAEFASPCSPAFVFCSPRSCCRCRSWSSGSARRRCCARPTSNLPATRRGARRPKPRSRSRAKPQGRCWRCCASSRRSAGAKTAGSCSRRRGAGRASHQSLDAGRTARRISADRANPQQAPASRRVAAPKPEETPPPETASPQNRCSRKVRHQARRQPAQSDAPASADIAETAACQAADRARPTPQPTSHASTEQDRRRRRSAPPANVARLLPSRPQPSQTSTPVSPEARCRLDEDRHARRPAGRHRNASTGEGRRATRHRTASAIKKRQQATARGAARAGSRRARAVRGAAGAAATANPFAPARANDRPASR